jgi:hypothetical protein
MFERKGGSRGEKREEILKLVLVHHLKDWFTLSQLSPP